MAAEGNQNEEFRVSGEDIARKVKEIIEAGNARRIILKNEKGDTLLEIPVTLAAVGVLLAPTLAAVGALAGILTRCTIIVEKRH